MLNICYIKNDANGHKTEDDEDLIAERMEGECPPCPQFLTFFQV